jgi:hypothetical protein
MQLFTRDAEALFHSLAQSLECYVKHQHQEYPDRTRGQHTAEHRRANGAPTKLRSDRRARIATERRAALEVVGHLAPCLRYARVQQRQMLPIFRSTAASSGSGLFNISCEAVSVDVRWRTGGRGATPTRRASGVSEGGTLGFAGAIKRLAPWRCMPPPRAGWRRDRPA